MEDCKTKSKCMKGQLSELGQSSGLRMKTESREIFVLCLNSKENIDLKPKLTSQVETFPHQKAKTWDFSAGPRVKTLCFHWSGYEFDPW